MKLVAHIGFDAAAARVLRNFFGIAAVQSLLADKYAFKCCADVLENGAHARRVLQPLLGEGANVLFAMLGMHFGSSVSATVHELRDLGLDADPHPVFLVSRQDCCLENLYHQYVHDGGTKLFSDFVESVPLASLEWDRVLASVPETPGAMVLPCEPEALTPSGSANIIEALLACFDIPLTIDLARFPGGTFAPKAIEVQRRANIALPSSEARQVRDWLVAEHPAAGCDRGRLFDDEDRHRIIARFADSNKRLFEKHLRRFDGRFYFGE